MNRAELRKDIVDAERVKEMEEIATTIITKTYVLK